jgi:tripartite-type tricarboxylate transporter receptor subunit TctC
MTRSEFLRLLAGLTALASVGSVPAASYPAKPVRIVVPYPAGGGIDILARALAAELSSAWAQPVVVENVPGANTIVGAQRVVSASADGHTLFMSLTSTVVANRFLYKKLPYDPDRSFVPVSALARTSQLILAHTDTAFTTLRDVIAAGRQPGSKLAYASPGKGSQEQLLFGLIAKREGIPLLGVPYKGVAPALTAAAAGEVQLTAASPALATPLIQDRRLKPLAIAAVQRSAMFPQVPTTREEGLPYAISTITYGLFMKAGTPPAILQKVHGDVVRVVSNAEFVSRNLTSRGLELVANTPQDFQANLQAELALTSEMVKVSGLTPD